MASCGCGAGMDFFSLCAWDGPLPRCIFNSPVSYLLSNGSVYIKIHVRQENGHHWWTYVKHWEHLQRWWMVADKWSCNTWLFYIDFFFTSFPFALWLSYFRVPLNSFLAGCRGRPLPLQGCTKFLLRAVSGLLHFATTQIYSGACCCAVCFSSKLLVSDDAEVAPASKRCGTAMTRARSEMAQEAGTLTMQRIKGAKCNRCTCWGRSINHKMLKRHPFTYFTSHRTIKQHPSGNRTKYNSRKIFMPIRVFHGLKWVDLFHIT